MPHAVKVAISLPATILDSVEKERSRRGESRSEFFRHALEAFLRDLQHRKDVERYVQGYVNHPEQAAETDAIRTASHAILAEEPWDLRSVPRTDSPSSVSPTSIPSSRYRSQISNRT